MISSRHLPALLVSAVLVTLPLAIWAERAAPEVWQQRIVLPVFDPEPNRHTPRFTEGVMLPPAVTADRTLTAAENPIIITGLTRIEPGVRLTLEEGVHVVAHEFAGFEVAGELIARGTSERPVRFTSNELHEDNRIWTGVIAMAGGRVTLDHVVVADASPAVSCLTDSTTAVTNSVLQRGSVGLFRQSSNCTIATTTIRGVGNGIISHPPLPTLDSVTIGAGRKDIVTINSQP